MTRLQQALSKVKSPTIPIERVNGATYQVQTQRAEQVQQTNYKGQLLGLMGTATKAYGQEVQRQWSKAEEEFNNASAQPDFDELKWLEEKAKEESQGFFGAVSNGINEAIGIDPNEYRKAVAMYKESERQMFDIDKEIEVNSKAGRYINYEALQKDRDTRRKVAQEALSKTYGVDVANSYMMKGMARNNESSTKALATIQAVSTDRQLKNAGFQNTTAEVNKLQAAGVENIALYKDKIQQAVNQGQIRGVPEQQEFLLSMSETFAKSGNIKMTMAWLDEPQSAYSGKSLGEVLPKEITDGLVQQAEEAQFTQNQELMDKWNRRNDEILIKSYSDPFAAMRELDKQGQYLEQLQPSNITTMQSRQLQDLRGNILRQQGLLNAEREKRVEKDRKQMFATNIAVEAIRSRQAGNIVSLKDNPNFSDKDLDRAGIQMLTNINASDSLTPMQKMEETIKLISIMPDSASIRGAVNEQVQSGLEGINVAMMNVSNGIVTDEPPEAFMQTLEMYRANPTGFGKITDSQTLAKLQTYDAQLKQLGWQGFSKAMSKAHLMDKEQKKSFTAQIYDTTQDLRLDVNQMKTVETSSMMYLGMGYDFDTAVEKGIKDYEKTVTMIDGYPLRNSTLAPSGNSQEVPVIQAAIQDQVDTLKEKMPNSMFRVDDDEFGNIYIEDTSTGRVWKTKAEDVYQSYLLRNDTMDADLSREEQMGQSITESQRIAQEGNEWVNSPYNHKTYKQANPWK